LEATRYDGAELVGISLRFDLGASAAAVVCTTKRTGIAASKGLST
jgi:hypothetical protein